MFWMIKILDKLNKQETHIINFNLYRDFYNKINPILTLLTVLHQKKKATRKRWLSKNYIVLT